MTRVLDNLDPAVFGQPQHAFHIGCASAPVDGHYRRGVLGDRLLGGYYVNVERVLFNVAKDRDRADIQHAERGGDERVRRDDDLVAGNDADRAQRHLESGGTPIDRDTVFGALMRGERLLERRYVGPVGREPLAGEDGLADGFDVGRVADRPAVKLSVAKGVAAVDR